MRLQDVTIGQNATAGDLFSTGATPHVRALRPAGFSLFPFLGLCLTLSGCGAGANKSSLVGVNTGAAAASTYLAALGPGIVGEIKGLKLSTADHQRALTAEYRALEGTPSGQEVEWEGKGASGTIVAAAPYQVGSQNCRQLTHTVTIDDREQVARGVACRNGNGTWTPL